MNSRVSDSNSRVPDSNGFPLSRRRFIAVAMLLAAGGLPAALPATEQTGTAGHLLTALTDRAAAARLGRAYLAAFPAEAEPDTLLNLLIAAVRAHHGSLPETPRGLVTVLGSLVKQEYVSAPLVEIDGWLLAPTEARLYGLAALAR
jgi:hypothetical protein